MQSYFFTKRTASVLATDATNDFKQGLTCVDVGEPTAAIRNGADVVIAGVQHQHLQLGEGAGNCVAGPAVGERRRCSSTPGPQAVALQQEGLQVEEELRPPGWKLACTRSATTPMKGQRRKWLLKGHSACPLRSSNYYSWNADIHQYHPHL